MDCLLWNASLSALLSLGFISEIQNFLDSLTINTVGVYSFKNQSVALGVVMVTRTVMNVSSCPHALI